jgi:putative FmdB family regulatory protein
MSETWADGDRESTMPIYEYVCNECSHRFEEFTWTSAEAGAATCPDCGAGDPRRVISLVAVGSKKEAHAREEPCGPNCCRLH